jgi:protein-S-isoprenylcysteine O-methyltransferase Ste14
MNSSIQTRLIYLVTNENVKRSILIIYFIIAELLFRPKVMKSILANFRGRFIAIQTYILNLVVNFSIFFPQIRDVEFGRLDFIPLWADVAIFITIGFGVLLRVYSMILIKDGESKNLLNRKPMLIQTGPYAWIRHPQYLANFLVWGGCLFGYFKNWSVVGVILMFAFGILRNKANNEEEYLIVEYPELYDKYSRITKSQFIPFLF